MYYYIIPKYYVDLAELNKVNVGNPCFSTCTGGSSGGPSLYPSTCITVLVTVFDLVVNFDLLNPKALNLCSMSMYLRWLSVQLLTTVPSHHNQFPCLVTTIKTHNNHIKSKKIEVINSKLIYYNNISNF